MDSDLALIIIRYGSLSSYNKCIKSRLIFDIFIKTLWNTLIYFFSYTSRLLILDNAEGRHQLDKRQVKNLRQVKHHKTLSSKFLF